MTDSERLSLAIFAHAKPVPYSEYLYLNFFSGAKLKPKQASDMLRRLCFSGLVERMHVGGSKELDSFILTDKGDIHFRKAMISKGGDFRYYRYCERGNIESMTKWGDGKHISEDDMIKNLDPGDPNQGQILNSILANKRRTASIMKEISRFRDARRG